MDALVFLTAELKSRDLDTRLLIAAHLVRAGFVAIVGQQWAMFTNREKLPKGCYLFKTANMFQAGMMAKCASAGHLIVSCDEEALPFAGDGALDNVDAAAMEHSHLFLAQSESHRKILAETFPSAAGRIRTAGNPRIDLLELAKTRFADETATLRKQMGRFVLFNTSFALTNSVWGSEEGAVTRMLAGSTIDPNTQAGREEIDSRLAFERETRVEILALMQWMLKEFADMRVVVRPHPAEDAEGWKKIFPAHKSLTIAAGTNPIPWMLAAEAMVHANSTTGLESAVLRRPCLNISPPRHDAWVHKFIMRDLNVTAANAEQAKSVLTELLNAGRGPLAESTPTLHAFPKDAAAAMATAIVQLMEKHGAKTRQISPFKWQPVERTEPQRAKFTAGLEEIEKGVAALFPIVGARAGTVRQLDDSVFLIAP